MIADERDSGAIRASRGESRRGWGRGPAMQPPYCPHYPRCIGCPLIAVPYREQLERKRAIVREAFAASPALVQLSVPPVIASPRRLGYRSRVKLVVRRNRDAVAIGLYVPGSHRVMDISSCPVHPRALNQIVHYLKKKIIELGIVPYDERDDRGDLRYVDLRYSVARREASVTLITRHRSFAQGIVLARSLQRRFPFVIGVIQNINQQRGNVLWGSQFQTLGGRDTLMERIGDLQLVYPPGVFSQANPFTARLIYQHVGELARLGGTEDVVDLYCGVGPMALGLANTARQIWAVDESEAAVRAAKQNARRNGRGNCRFIAGDIAATLAQLSDDLSSVDLVVVNPPRKGVGQAALVSLMELGPAKLIYVSCEASSLARDLDRLVAAGYRIVQLQPFDMFPQTAEVETVVLAERSK
jgi:23S rRNA (uracil1939-C5)-methyltransferase